MEFDGNTARPTTEPAEEKANSASRFVRMFKFTCCLTAENDRAALLHWLIFETQVESAHLTGLSSGQSE